MFLFELRDDTIVVELRDDLGSQSEIVQTYVWTVVSVDGGIVELGAPAVISRLRVEWQWQEFAEALTLQVVARGPIRLVSNEGGGTCCQGYSLGFVTGMVQLLNSLGNYLFIWAPLNGWR